MDHTLQDTTIATLAGGKMADLIVTKWHHGHAVDHKIDTLIALPELRNVGCYLPDEWIPPTWIADVADYDDEIRDVITAWLTEELLDIPDCDDWAYPEECDFDDVKCEAFWPCEACEAVADQNRHDHAAEDASTLAHDIELPVMVDDENIEYLDVPVFGAMEITITLEVDS